MVNACSSSVFSGAEDVGAAASSAVAGEGTQRLADKREEEENKYQIDHCGSPEDVSSAVMRFSFINTFARASQRLL